VERAKTTRRLSTLFRCWLLENPGLILGPWLFLDCLRGAALALIYCIYRWQTITITMLRAATTAHLINGKSFLFFPLAVFVYGN